MKAEKFKNLIKKYEIENLCWFTEQELNDMNISFKIVSRFMDSGILVYIPYDNVYMGYKTYNHKIKGR